MNCHIKDCIMCKLGSKDPVLWPEELDGDFLMIRQNKKPDH